MLISKRKHFLKISKLRRRENGIVGYQGGREGGTKRKR